MLYPYCERCEMGLSGTRQTAAFTVFSQHHTSSLLTRGWAQRRALSKLRVVNKPTGRGILPRGHCFEMTLWLISVFLFAAILSILGNAAVLVSAGRRLAMLRAPELLTVNLAITDIGMALSMYPLSIASAFNHAWIGGDASCLYYGLMGMIFSITSIMTLAVMGMVRYLVTGSPPKKGNPRPYHLLQLTSKVNALKKSMFKQSIGLSVTQMSLVT